MGDYPDKKFAFGRKIKMGIKNMRTIVSKLGNDVRTSTRHSRSLKDESTITRNSNFYYPVYRAKSYFVVTSTQLIKSCKNGSLQSLPLRLTFYKT